MVNQELEVNWRRFSPWTKSETPPGKVRKEKPRNKLVGLPVSRGSIQALFFRQIGEDPKSILGPPGQNPQCSFLAWTTDRKGEEKERPS